MISSKTPGPGPGENKQGGGHRPGVDLGFQRAGKVLGVRTEGKREGA